MGVAQAPARIAREQGGYTFVELLVAATIALLVVGAGMTLLVTALRAEPRISERAGQIQQGRTMIERISRELRQGEAIDTATSSSLRILTRVDGAVCNASSQPEACWVTYTCGSSSCSRTVSQLAAPSSQTVVAGIIGPGVFSYQGLASSPDYVGIQLVFPQADGDEAVTLADGVALRNYLESAT